MRLFIGPKIFLSLALLIFSLHAKEFDTGLEKKTDSVADYIVVGIGTAGAVMAKKLSDDKTTSVIALHIGKNLTQDPLIKFSKNSVFTVVDGLIGFPYYETGSTVPQKEADNRQLHWALANPEGGASSVNAGAYCRGTNQLYAKWEAIAGPDWSVERINALYKRIENYRGKTTHPISRGKKGPLNIFQVIKPTKVSKKFTQATIQATGYPYVLDYNDPSTPIGVSSRFQYSQKGIDGRLRVSSVNAYLDKTVVSPDGFGLDGRKLRIFFDSFALKTIWQGKRAVGVEYLSDGSIKQVFAKKGVIVCCGLRSSPFLLHSGIGSKALLKKLKIPVKFDNPNVGQGLADQPAVRVIFTSNPADTPILKFPGFFANISWLPAPNGDQKKREIRIATSSVIPGVTLGLIDLCQARSRGTVTINSSDPTAPPVLNLNVLESKTDLALFQAALQVYLKKINEVISKNDPLYELIFPDPAILDNPDLVKKFIKENVASNEHFQSHCRMAPEKRGGVVDSQGRVYGVQNLYVADDSVVPLCMDGSPMATAYLIPENISDMIIANQAKFGQGK